MLPIRGIHESVSSNINDDTSGLDKAGIYVVVRCLPSSFLAIWISSNGDFLHIIELSKLHSTESGLVPDFTSTMSYLLRLRHCRHTQLKLSVDSDALYTDANLMGHLQATDRILACTVGDILYVSDDERPTWMK